MLTTASSIGQVIDYWVAKLDSLFAEDPTTYVLDGPIGGLAIDAYQAIVAVGATEADDGGDDNQGAHGEQVWRWIGARARTETYEIPCFVLTADGSSLKTCRDRCLTVQAAVINAVQADLSSGGLVTISTTVTGQDFYQQANSDGWTCTFHFVISVQNVIR